MQYRIFSSIILCLAIVAIVVVHGYHLVGDSVFARDTVTMAFVGDFGLTSDTNDVLDLIKRENPDLLMMLGDFDYVDRPHAFELLLTSKLGDMPIVGVMGNHDQPMWSEYQNFLERRHDKIHDLVCIGDRGTQEACIFNNIFYVPVALGLEGEDNLQFLRQTLSQSSRPWKLCIWHLNHELFQAGYKSTEVPMEAYDICRQYGAPVITAHEHSYSRTYLLDSYETQHVASTDADMTLERGVSFAVVSGLGGKSIRVENPDVAHLPHFATVYTATQNARPGVLFCTFETTEDNPRAWCQFKNVDDEVVDEFSLSSAL